MKKGTVVMIGESLSEMIEISATEVSSLICGMSGVIKASGRIDRELSLKFRIVKIIRQDESFVLINISVIWSSCRSIGNHISDENECLIDIIETEIYFTVDKIENYKG